jgi:hypothetical protein
VLRRYGRAPARSGVACLGAFLGFSNSALALWKLRPFAIRLGGVHLPSRCDAGTRPRSDPRRFVLTNTLDSRTQGRGPSGPAIKAFDSAMAKQ